MKLTQEQMEKAYQKWSLSKLTEPLSTTFVATIHPRDNQETISQKLKALNSKVTLEKQDTLPQDITPMPEDFVDVEFRALSATILADRPIDFSHQPMLKRSVKKLMGQTVYKDHEMSVNNWVGKVISTKWDTETKDIPPGINAILRLDTVKDPMLVRGILQDAIHSTSVTVTFAWKPSHPDLMDNNTFFNHLGEEIEDEMVRIVVTEIDKYWEISVVWQGADEFAKRIEGGETVLGKEEDLDEDQESLSLKGGNSLKLDNNKEEPMDKLKKLLAEKFGVEVTEENFATLLENKVKAESIPLSTKITSLETENADLKARLDRSTQEGAELSKKLEEGKKAVAAGESHLKDVRALAIKNYKLAKGEGIKELIIKTLETSELEIVQAWNESFEQEVQEKFPLQCQSCKSTNVSRQSSSNKADPESKETKELKTSIVNEEVANKLKDLHK